MSNITLTATTPEQDTKDATVTITLNPAPTAGQTLRFSLTVVDNNGLKSQPAFVNVTVAAAPVAVLKGPAAVLANATIALDGSASTPTGQIATYKWQLVPASK